MARKKTEEIIEDITRPIAEKMNLNLIDVEYKKEGSNFVLRIIIDRPEGITIDDCENLSRQVDEKIDELDPIENSYSLEVQSPGERILKKDREFDYFKGRNVEVKLYEGLENKRIFEGKLEGLKQNLIVIVMEDGEIKEFPSEKVAYARLKINF